MARRDETRADAHLQRQQLRQPFPQIIAAVTLLPVQSCLIDGEAIVCNGDGLAVFDLIGEYRHHSALFLS